MRCQPCERANIVCSLAPDTIVPREPAPPSADPAAPPATDIASRPKATPVSQQKFIPSSYTSAVPSDHSKQHQQPTVQNQAPQVPQAAPQTKPQAKSQAKPQALPQTRTLPQAQPQAQQAQPPPSAYSPPGEPIIIKDEFPTLSNTTRQNIHPPNHGKRNSAPEISGLAPEARESMGVWVKQVAVQPKLHPIIHEYLKSIEAFSMPLRPNRDGLINIYLSSIHEVLPLLDKDQFLKLHDIGQAPTLLLHAVLLVASRHPQAIAYLGTQPVRDFCQKTAEKIRALLYAEVEQDRLTLVRVYALLSLHSEGPDGLENSCCDLQKAIHYSISLGIHHERPFIDREELRRLWWTVWCMDRINACVNARPLICNLEDVSALEVSKDEHYNLGTLIESCKKLENVIYLYRPNHRSKRELLLLDQDVVQMPVEDGTSAVFALLHYTAVVLAHKRSTDDNPQSSNSTTSPPGTYTLDTPLSKEEKPQNSTAANEAEYQNRKVEFSNTILLRAAGFILHVIQNYQQILPPLPLIPYCVSLTLTVFLRSYPKADPNYGLTWKNGCSLLESMGPQWWVADAMGGMGRKVFGRLPENAPEHPYATESPSLIKKQAMKSSTKGSKKPLAQTLQKVSPNVFARTNPSQEPSANSAVLSNAETMDSLPPFDAQGSLFGSPVNNDSNSSNTPIGGIPMEDQFLDMFSQLPNATSFLDEALATEHFDEISEWF